MSGGETFSDVMLAVTAVPTERERATRYIVRVARDADDAALLLDAVFGETAARPPRGLRSDSTAAKKPAELAKPTRTKRTVCGSVKGYRVHQGRHETICQPCRDAMAEQRAEERAAAAELMAAAAAAADKCGSVRGYRIHLELREVPCQACCDANAADRRKRRPQRKRAAANTEHGQPGGYYWHRRRKEEPCDACREAHAEGLREYRAKKKEALADVA